MFRNVGKPQSDAGEILKIIHTRFKTRRKFEIKKTGYSLLGGLRALAQTISYEVRLAFILFSFVVFVCTYNFAYFYFFLQVYLWLIFLFSSFIFCFIYFLFG